MRKEGRRKIRSKYVKHDGMTKKKDTGKLRAYITDEKLRMFRKLVWS